MGERTSPPPTTRTCLFLTCQATIREPPPWTGGKFRDISREWKKVGLELAVDGGGQMMLSIPRDRTIFSLPPFFPFLSHFFSLSFLLPPILDLQTGFGDSPHVIL